MSKYFFLRILCIMFKMLFTVKNKYKANTNTTVMTKIRLLIKEQSDQGLHCLPLNLTLVSHIIQQPKIQTVQF